MCKGSPNSKYPAGLIRDECIMLWVVNHLDELRDRGYITGGLFQCADLGKAVVKELDQMKFEPTDEEIKDMLGALQAMALEAESGDEDDL
jgi:hypothetical protein